MVPARPAAAVPPPPPTWDVLMGGGDAGSSSSGESLGDMAAAALGEALASGHGRHRAYETPLGPGDACDSSGAHRASVRWLCPATWRTAAPDRDGGHTTLLAVEQPERCTWVAWVSSLLLCADPRLLPPPAQARRAVCRSEEAGGAAAEESQGGSPTPRPHDASDDRLVPEPAVEKRELQAETSPEEWPWPQQLDRTGVAFRVGEAVQSTVDGTRGVVVGWAWTQPDSGKSAAVGAAFADAGASTVVPAASTTLQQSVSPLHKF